MFPQGLSPVGRTTCKAGGEAISDYLTSWTNTVYRTYLVENLLLLFLGQAIANLIHINLYFVTYQINKQ